MAPSEGSDCVVIDPGMEAAPTVRRSLQNYRLRPAAVLVTHGHVDHVHSAATIADEFDVPVYCHPADRQMLADPMLGISPDMGRMLLQMYGTTDLVPAKLQRDLDPSQPLQLAGLDFDVLHAPGHTPGCCLLRTAAEEGEIVFTGDVLFAGSVGRTDLPGGDGATMGRSLRDVVLALDDAAHILPGHGPATQMARERATNQYLQPGVLARLTNESDV